MLNQYYFCAKFALVGHKEHYMNIEGYCLYLTGEVMGESEMVISDCVSDSSAISYISGMVRIDNGVIVWCTGPMFFSNYGNVVENNTCNNCITIPFWDDPEPTKAMETSLCCGLGSGSG